MIIHKEVIKLNEYVLRINNLKKNFKKHKVLKEVSLNIKKGDIYGFVGKNGSGKTTVIRAIAGLIIPDSGEIELFGDTEEDNVIKQRDRTGILIEEPTLYKNMTARENLELVTIERGIPDKDIIDKTLSLVGLGDIDISKKKVKNFSLGMKQRLGIAMAIISDPEFLILDEPINGLDPIGIRTVRELLLKLNKERGTTILISSHILSELKCVATKYGFINHGKIVEEISAKELMKKCRNYIHLKTSDNSKAIIVLEKDLGIMDYKVLENDIIHIYDNFDKGTISLKLARQGIAVNEIFERYESIEDYFTKIVGSEDNE